MPDIVQVPVDVVQAPFWEGFGRLVGQPHASEDHRVAREIKPVLHPPHVRLASIVVASDQNLSTGQIGHDPLRCLTDLHVPEVDHHVLWLHGVAPVLDDSLREVRGTLAIRCNVLVIEVGIRNQIHVHSCPLKLVQVVGTDPTSSPLKRRVHISSATPVLVDGLGVNPSQQAPI